jgi:protein ImuB
MSRRFLAIWFRHLTTDWMIRRQPDLKEQPFVMAAPEHGRMVVKAVSATAMAKGVHPGMVVADCRAILPTLQVFDDKPELGKKLLNAFAEWSLRYTPIAAVDLPDGLILDISGCAHLWGGERPYLRDILAKLRGFGYNVRAAIADTVGAAWANTHYGQIRPIIETGQHREALLPLPPAALRLEASILERLEKLGLYTIGSFIRMPRVALRRRFGQSLLSRIDQAIGEEHEVMQPIRPVVPYQERLPSLEPIRTATGIEIALRQLLETLCNRLEKEGKGLRTCVFKCYRMDGNIQQIGIGTVHPSRNVEHLFKLFEIKIPTIEPDLGIELFLLEAPVVEDVAATQEALWNKAINNSDKGVVELLDRLVGKVGIQAVHRYLPDEHYWPERSVKAAATLEEKPATTWQVHLPRPVHLLAQPEAIEVTVAIPDYPPSNFNYKGKVHYIQKADGPERIEQEWWLQEGLYRDYYCVEDEKGGRYWLFRLGSYASGEPKWFIHGFFA